MPNYKKLPAPSQHFSGKPYQRMLDDLHLAGMADRTIYGYLRAVRQLAEFCKLSPDKITEEHLRQWLLHLKVDQQRAYGTLRVAFSGIKFCFTRTCRREWNVLSETKLQNVKALPNVLTIAQVHQIIDACNTQRMKTYFWTVYSLGLRLEEGLNLHIGDIDSLRMTVHVHRGKGAKDRYLPLPSATLQLLRAYWKTHRHRVLLFPAQQRKHKHKDKTGSAAATPMSPTSVQGAIKKVVRQLKFGKQVSTHTLRHSYASHLLEAGVSIKAVQKYLGHSSLQTTLIYLHLTDTAEADARRVIEDLFVKEQKPKDQSAR